MKWLSQFILAVLFLGVGSVSYSAAQTEQNDNDEQKQHYPLGCTPVGYQFSHYNVILKPTAKYEPQTLYFIKNTSNKEVNLFQARTGNESFIVYLESTMKPQQWSALALDEKNAKFICTHQNKNQSSHQIIKCKNVLDICEFTQARFGENHRGNYWVTENKSMKEAYQTTKLHGVLLVDPNRK